ncbi:hypothetical protein HMPREF9161_01529 [Selenomonas sp. F0473]|nr:hypothetical protein HMPREF9161_01529 [Selenomonas sp. F0473]
MMNLSTLNSAAGAREKDKRGQAGFSLLSTLLAVMILGIVLAIAVPRFSSAIAAANTVKVQADLTALDTAIVLYQTAKGKDPTAIKDLADYVTEIEHLKPPSGKAHAGGTEVALDGASYTIKTVDGVCRAVCVDKTAEEFGRKE